MWQDIEIILYRTFTFLLIVGGLWISFEIGWIPGCCLFGMSFEQK